jgi:plastocyanin
MKISLSATVAMVAAGLAIACGGGGGGANTPAGPAPTQTIGATVHITANGLTPADVLIEPGQRVRFINDDTRPHQVQTNPHLVHTDCPANNIVILNPGQTADTGTFNDRKGCGYHDHLLPDTAVYYGLIRVGTDEGKGPVYSRGW